MNQSEFVAITHNFLKARGKLQAQGAMCFSFASFSLKNWRENFKPITRRSSRNGVITFDSHLKSALIEKNINIINNSELYLRDYNSTALQKHRKRENYSNLVIRVQLQH